MPKPWPVLRTDEEAEHFVATADLTEYDVAALRSVRFDFAPADGVRVLDAATGEQLYPADVAVTPAADDADGERRTLEATPR